MMNIKRMLLITLSLCSINSYADVSNGSFEQWSNGLPKDWTTIDSGIAVSPSTTPVKEGVTSLAVTVNTANQAATDLQQLVPVVAGQSYTFSTWIYHTEGGVKARLYVDGYQNYSDPNLVNQWQQISTSYTASSTKNIAVGLRFYDVTGFDGSELVYVDDFQPTAATTTGGGTGGSCTNTTAVLTLVTDNYGSETSWSITDANAKTIASDSNLTSNFTYQKTFCLTDGNYQFTINDAYGDGICCTYGSGSYDLSVSGKSLLSGASFTSSETKSFTISTTTGGGGTGGGDATHYYDSVGTETGYALKTLLHNLINNQTPQSYSAIWSFYADHSLDNYYEHDGSILDIYSENPNGADSYNFTKVTNQCGSYSGEGGCYNREHSFPKSWFGGMVEPMATDIHHIFATDGFVNSKRSNYPYGEVGNATFTSNNGSKLGTASASLGYTGVVFEPIDEFKGDVARAYFYMATRYEDVIGSWQKNTVYSDAVLDGSSTRVFEPWVVNMLLRWSKNDPVSQKEIDRNNAAYIFQGNRNPFIDHPEYIDRIWTTQ